MPTRGEKLGRISTPLLLALTFEVVEFGLEAEGLLSLTEDDEGRGGAWIGGGGATMTFEGIPAEADRRIGDAEGPGIPGTDAGKFSSRGDGEGGFDPACTFWLRGDAPAVAARRGTRDPGEPGAGEFVLLTGSGGNGESDHMIATGPSAFAKSITVFPKIVDRCGIPAGPTRCADAALKVACRSGELPGISQGAGGPDAGARWEMGS